MDLLQQPLDSGQHPSKSAVVELELHLRDLDVTGLAFKQISLEVSFVLDVEGEHQRMLAHLTAVLGLGGVVSAVVAGEAHDDEVSKVGDAGPATEQLASLEADLTGDFKADRLVGQQIRLLKGLHEVQLVPHELSL